MAVAHIPFNDQLPHGRDLRKALNYIYEGREQLTEIVAIIAQMKDGGNVTAYIQQKFGCVDIPGAEALVAELESLNFKLTTNSSQTDVGNAITQANAKLA